MSNNVEETEDSMGQDKILNGASSNSSLLSHVTHLCLMPRGSKVSPTLEPNTSCVDVDEDNDDRMKIYMKRRITYEGKVRLSIMLFPMI
jgi:hypothetical protein